MNRPLNYVVLFCFFVCLLSCHTNKKVSDKENSLSSISENLTKKGFKKAVIIKNKGESNCALLVSLTDSKEMLDPIGIDQNNFTNEEKIWLKFTSLRMKNRCKEARPVNVIEIKKRDD
ncbi:hypothetical protein [Tenacibaculum amylolyticum]|uniref:hypothetical protein n=1 Tax=Tenacibaculum amylolyticum TaxID=104269 RepID=UPI0038962A2C